MSSEADLARKVIKWLEGHGWDVYQEVEYRGSIADIVCLCDPKVWVIECKQSLGFAVMEQAMYWRGRANYSSVAVPLVKRYSRGRVFAEQVCRSFGLGLIEVGSASVDYGEQWSSGGVVERVPPKLYRKSHAESIREVLQPEHKTFAAAGSPTGKRWTPFQGTVQQLTKFVKANPGCSMKEMVDGIRHHYTSASSAKGSLRKWIDAGTIPGIRVEYKGRTPLLYWDDKKFEAQQKAGS